MKSLSAASVILGLLFIQISNANKNINTNSNTIEIESKQETDGSYYLKRKYSIPLDKPPYPTIKAAY